MGNIEEGEITEDTPVVARIRGDAPSMVKVRDEKPEAEKTDPKPKKPVKLNWDEGVVIPVQLSKRKNIKVGWNQVVKAHTRFDEDTD